MNESKLGGARMSESKSGEVKVNGEEGGEDERKQTGRRRGRGEGGRNQTGRRRGRATVPARVNGTSESKWGRGEDERK